MYEIKKTKNIENDIHVSDGEKELTFHYDINVFAIMNRFNSLRKELAAASDRVRDNPDDEALEQFGRVIVAFFECLFGDSTKEIIDFYDGDYYQMLGDFSEHIREVLIPKINEAEKELVNKYKGFKK